MGLIPDLKQEKTADLAVFPVLDDYNNKQDLKQFIAEKRKAELLLRKVDEFYKSFVASKTIKLSDLVNYPNIKFFRFVDNTHILDSTYRDSSWWAYERRLKKVIEFSLEDVVKSFMTGGQYLKIMEDVNAINNNYDKELDDFDLEQLNSKYSKIIYKVLRKYTEEYTVSRMLFFIDNDNFLHPIFLRESYFNGEQCNNPRIGMSNDDKYLICEFTSKYSYKKFRFPSNYPSTVVSCTTKLIFDCETNELHDFKISKTQRDVQN